MEKLKQSDKLVKIIVQFVKFGIVGISNTLISYVIYLVCVYFGVHYLLSSIVGFVVSVTNSFYWNNKYVFKACEGKRRTLWASYIKTFLSYAGTGLILANVLLYVWIDVLMLPEWAGPLLNLLITIPLNFVLNKLWAFKDK